MTVVPVDVRLCLGALEAYRAVLIAARAPAEEIAAVDRKKTALAAFISDTDSMFADLKCLVGGA